MMGAVAFQKGLGACHSLAHPLSSEKGLHHGLANALCLPAVVEFNERASPERLERVRAILGPASAPLRAMRSARFGGGSAFRMASAPRASRRPTSRSSPTRRSRTPATAATRAPVTRDDLAALYRTSL